MVTQLSLMALGRYDQCHVLALDLGGDSWSARTWQDPGRVLAGQQHLPHLPASQGSFPRWFLPHRKLGFSQYQLPGIQNQESVPSCHGMGTALLGTGRAAWLQRAVSQHRDTCQPSPCGTHWTPSGPGVVGTVPWPRGTEQVCRAVLAAPLICSNPVCTRGGASPDWPQGDTGHKCPVAGPAPSVAGRPHSCQAHRDGLSPPSYQQDGIEPGVPGWVSPGPSGGREGGVSPGWKRGARSGTEYRRALCPGSAEMVPR